MNRLDCINGIGNDIGNNYLNHLDRSLILIIKSYLPKYYKCDECKTKKYSENDLYLCDYCKITKLCPGHTKRGHYYSWKYRQFISKSMCDNCCWYEI